MRLPALNKVISKLVVLPRSRPARLLLAILLFIACILMWVSWNNNEVLLMLAGAIFGSVSNFVWKREDDIGEETEGFDYVQFASKIKKSKSRVRILGTFIYPFTDLPEHADKRRLLLDAMKQAVEKNGVRIEILLLHPFSDAAKQRDDDRADERVREMIRQNLHTLASLENSAEYAGLYRGMTIKLYDKLPPYSLFQWDDICSLSFFQRNEPVSGPNTRRFLFRADNNFGDFVSREFDGILNDEESKGLPDYFSLNLQLPGSSDLVSVPFLNESDELFLLLQYERHARVVEFLRGREDECFQVQWHGRTVTCTAEAHDVESVNLRALVKYGPARVPQLVYRLKMNGAAPAALARTA
jgi:hypothetical protein